jgi:hypothetical protein
MSRYKQICNECKIHYKSNGQGSKYCSANCRQIARARDRHFTPCSYCFKDVRYFPNSEHKNKKNIFCSNKCQGEWMKTNTQNLQLAERANKMRKNWTLDCIDKAIETRKKNGNIIDWNKAGWKQYWKRCDWLTRKIRKQMLENWDGYDYISGDYIKDNLNLHYSHGDYPTLDHIKPRSQCFKEGLSPYEATKPENLAWTTRKNNSKKHNKKLEN